MLPAIKITEPYSPVARANIMPAPVKSAGVISGSSTRRNVVKRFAPKVAAASSYSPDNSSNTGCTARTIKGRLTTTSAIQMPTGVNAILMPKGSKKRPIQPLGAYRVANAMPVTAVGSANGKSTSAFTSPLSGNS